MVQSEPKTKQRQRPEMKKQISDKNKTVRES